MSKWFAYFENEDGGMAEHYFTSTKDMPYLYGWMSDSTKGGDLNLEHFISTAKIGEMFEHRLGICVRLKDVEGF